MSLQVLIKMEEKKLQIMAEMVINGDEEVLEYLQFDEMDVVGSDFRTVTWETHCANYHYCVHVLVVATILNLHVLRRTARMLLRHINHIARHHFQCELPEIATTCTIENLAQILSMVLTDVPPAHLSRS